jgi:DNA-binding NarL/FixJ family response regulator
MPLQVARARLGLARCLEDGDVRAATEECRAAVATFEQLGARRDLDGASDVRRRLGVGARVGSRATNKLTRREEEVLSLLALGLSNAKIGSRLFISPKTVEHHVGHILEKLDLETRAAAAAFAAKRGPKPGVK